MKHVLITGGSGLIGQRLINKLIQKKHKVSVLSREARVANSVNYYEWDPAIGEIDGDALSKVDCIIHLAGAGIADKRWTKNRKKEIIDSRVESAKLIYASLKNVSHKPISFISSSAIGYYGTVTSEHIFEEEDPNADDFIGKVCKEWEEAADLFTKLGSRVVKIRTGLVLSKKGGLLGRLKPLIKLYLGSALAKGKQYMPWIHIEDLCDIYIEALENETMNGAYNAVAPQHVNNLDFTNELARSMNKMIILPPVPSFALKIVYGQMAEILIHGSRISSKKIQKTGFKFNYPELSQALASL